MIDRSSRRSMISRMDVVSDAITAIRTGRPFSARTVRTPPWGLRFPASSGAGFHVVFQGACWLLPGGRGAPTALHAGDRAASSAAVLICGSYQLDGASSHPLQAELPGVVHLPKR